MRFQWAVNLVSLSRFSFLASVENINKSLHFLLPRAPLAFEMDFRLRNLPDGGCVIYLRYSPFEMTYFLGFIRLRPIRVLLLAIHCRLDLFLAFTVAISFGCKLNSSDLSSRQ